MPDYKLPDVGEGLTEAEIVTWKVQVGDVLAVNDVVVEIETAKSLVELPTPYAGTVLALHVAEGETVAVGTPLVSIGAPVAADAEVAPAAPPAATDLSDPAAGGAEHQTLVGYGPRPSSGVRRARRGGATPGTEAGAAAQLSVQGAFGQGGAEAAAPVGPVEAVDPIQPVEAVEPVEAPVEVRALAKPPVRRLARDRGVDLGSVTPTGPHGTVTREDVEAAAAPTGPRQGVPGVGGSRMGSAARGEVREPVRGVRAAMARAMVESAFTAPHVTEWVTVDVTRTTRLLQRLRTHPDFAGVSVSPLLLAAKAVCLAVRRTPEVNAAWDEGSREVVLRSAVNLGIAAATPRGLVVPNVQDADLMTLPELARALNELSATARAGRTRPEEMTHGTFTITNVGVFGVDAGTPIINPGESAILCLGAVRPRPWVRKGRIKVRDVTTLALSFDHRVVDGEQGSRFLADVAAVLEDPASALLH